MKNCSPTRVPVVRFWALLIAALLIAAPIWAQKESVHLDYEPAAGCPDRAAFIAEVTARTTRARFVDETRDVRTFHATIRTEGDRIVGSIVSNSGQTGSERRVSGRTCGEVVSALALITALAIDPSASTQPSPPAQPADQSTPQEQPAAAPAIAPAMPRTGPMSTADDRNAAVSSWGLSWALLGEAAYGFTAGAPLPTFGGSVHAEAGPFARERRGPLFRIGAALLQSTSVHPSSDASIGEATFTLTVGRVGCSPINFRVANRLDLLPWLNVEVGRLSGHGSSSGLITNPHDKSMLWLSVQEGLEARWAASDSFWVGFDLRAAEPLVSHTFLFYPPEPTPVTRITSVPLFEAIVGVGIGGRIL
jgi:hypothetical protein